MAEIVELFCPMPECGEQLYLDWELSFPLHRQWHDGTLLTDDLPTPDGAYTGGWKVTCGDGHVILTPGPAGCECDDQGGPDCPHEHERDWSDDGVRTFRRHNAEQLVALVDRLEAVFRG